MSQRTLLIVDDASLEQIVMHRLGNEPEPLAAAVPELPDALTTLIMEALNREPADRPSAGALGRCLRDAAQDAATD